MLTIITNVWNEEYLLPWWLRHHLRLADRGIIIDHGSHDASRALCAAMAPTWDVRQTRCQDFGAVEVDQELMDVEREVTGWKIVLNMTEFLMGDLRAVMQGAGDAAVLRSRIMVDPPELVDVEPQPSIPLTIQRVSGIYNTEMRPGRLLHRLPCGDYTPGRHFWDDLTSACEVWWYGFSPWTPRGRARKLQIQQRVPARDREAQRGWHHVVDEAGLDAMYRRVVGQL